MRSLFRNVVSLLLAVAIALPGLTGCTVRAGIYDPYYHDYHPWNGEVVYYNNWEHDTHRDHRDFKKRSTDEQKQYWDWRHGHPDQH